MRHAWALVILLAGTALVGVGSCSGGEGTCAVKPCGAVQPVFLEFACSYEAGGGPTTYASIQRATVTGPCNAECVPQGSPPCSSLQVTPTDAGACSVGLVSSGDAAVGLTYVWAAQQIAGCPGCMTLDLTDAGSSPRALVRECDGSTE